MKSLMSYVTPTKNKRLKIAIFFGVANLLSFIGLCVYNMYGGKEQAYMALGGTIASINAPVYGYLFGETVRPSVDEEKANI